MSFPVAQLVKNLPAMQETWVLSLGWEDPLEKGRAIPSSILTWRIPWTVLSMGVAKSWTQLSDFHFQWFWRSALGPGSIENRCMRHWAPLRPTALQCQNRRAGGQGWQDPPACSGPWCMGGIHPECGCRPSSGRAGTCIPWHKEREKLLSPVRLFLTPWTVAHQAPPSMGFYRQEYWSGLPFPSPGDLPNPGTEPRSPTL